MPVCDGSCQSVKVCKSKFLFRVMLIRLYEAPFGMLQRVH